MDTQVAMGTLTDFIKQYLAAKAQAEDEQRARQEAEQQAGAARLVELSAEGEAQFAKLGGLFDELRAGAGAPTYAMHKLDKWERVIWPTNLAQVQFTLKREWSGTEDFTRYAVTFLNINYSGGDQHVYIRETFDAVELGRLLALAHERMTDRANREKQWYEDKVANLVAMCADPAWDDNPEISYRNFIEDYPASDPRIETAIANYRAYQKAQALAAVETQRQQQEVQSHVWFDFTVWRVTACTHMPEEEDYLHITQHEAYVLEPEPDADGWWPVVKQGVKTLTKFPHILMVEEVTVDDWKSNVARDVCEPVTIEGARVLQPPAGVVSEWVFTEKAPDPYTH